MPFGSTSPLLVSTLCDIFGFLFVAPLCFLLPLPEFEPAFPFFLFCRSLIYPFNAMVVEKHWWIVLQCGYFTYMHGLMLI
ncbi:uncharacterized protein EV422DRAFT_48295 [Fimicolochytrium jonesii]|uniref:uncharacterized protein n=1 Tax=Fimicolochytrium jonesii TaxID=1396493 RepID=UPI0022FF1B0B|nr:uncharacterized protein EV422DRAFT_48295 [Fimicolochytrium jonesii]KAI8820983.1 hypothetical protein EV422DRAFT_48295 [Fimicolochytrium jonesii]